MASQLLPRKPEEKVSRVVCRGRDRERAMQELMQNYRADQIVSAKPELVGGVLGFFQHEALVVTVEDEERPPSETGTPPPVSARPGRTRPVRSHPLDLLLDGTRDEVALGGMTLDELPESVKTFSQVLGEVVSSLGEEPGEYRPDLSHFAGRERPAEKEQARELPDPSGLAPDAPADEEPGVYRPDFSFLASPGRAGRTAVDRTAVDRTAVDRTAVDARARWAVVREMARTCGVPDALIPSEVPQAEEPRLQALFGRLPQPPPLPTTSGGLIAVVGSSLRGDGRLSGLLGAACAVRPTARAIAESVGCDAEDIALVCEALPDRTMPPGMSAHTPKQVESFAPGWRRDKVGVVAVYAPPLGEDQDWARGVLRAMRPSSVVAVASATTKPEDIERWVQTIGGADALALVEVQGTCTPGAVLSTGIPVRSLDGEAATPSQWAAICAARS